MSKGRLVRATESSLTLNGGIITARNFENTIFYSYDSEGKLTRKRVHPATGADQIVYYENPENEGAIVKFTAGGRTVTSHSKTDSFGRKIFDELQLSTGFVSRQFSYHAGEVTEEHLEGGKLKSSPTTQLVSQIVLSGGRAISYDYDAEERITRVTDSVDGVTEYTYDALGQLLTETVNGTVVNTMTYDNYGNIAAKNGIAYTYGDSAWKDLLTKVGDQTITYDAQGNPTSYLGHTLTWEKGRQLKSFDSNTYTYNANGIRTSKTVDGVKHTYTLEGAKILRETWGSNKLLPIYDNEDTVCGILYNNEPYYFQKNLQGDVIGITDKNGEVTARYHYDAWGVCTIVQDSSECGIAGVNPYRYRGYYYDAEIGLYYLQSRYYDAQVSWFLNADGLGILFQTGNQVLGTNLFTYCYNNSINLADPTGYQPKWAQVISRYAKGTLAYKMFLYATQKGWFSDLFWVAGFFRTSDGVYHTRQDCWQQFFGYNDFYDWAFNLGTSMSRAKFPFFSDSKEYIFWAWKGDYLNLGAGAELGIYSRLVVQGKSTGHWLAETKSPLSMMMTLRLCGKIIATYKPTTKQWWITSFNPYYQNVCAGSLSVTFTVSFSSNKKLFRSFYNKYGVGRYKSYMWKFDTENYKAKLVF